MSGKASPVVPCPLLDEETPQVEGILFESRIRGIRHDGDFFIGLFLHALRGSGESLGAGLEIWTDREGRLVLRDGPGLMSPESASGVSEGASSESGPEPRPVRESDLRTYLRIAATLDGPHPFGYAEWPHYWPLAMVCALYGRFLPAEMRTHEILSLETKAGRNGLQVVERYPRGTKFTPFEGVKHHRGANEPSPILLRLPHLSGDVDGWPRSLRNPTLSRPRAPRTSGRRGGGEKRCAARFLKSNSARPSPDTFWRRC